MDLPFWFRFPIFCAVVLAVLHILYEEVFEVRLAVTSFIFIMGMFAETIVCIVGAMLGYSVETARETTELFLLYNILSRLIWFIEIKTAFVLQRKTGQPASEKQTGLKCFSFQSAVFLSSCQFLDLRRAVFTLKLVASFLLLVINLFTYHSYYSIQEKTFYTAEKKFLTQQVESYATQLQAMGQMWEQMRMYRHETQQKNLLVQSYIEQGKYDKIKEIFCKDKTLTESRTCISKTGNVSMDALINYKASIAEKYGIRILFRCHCSIRYSF